MSTTTLSAQKPARGRPPASREENSRQRLLLAAEDVLSGQGRGAWSLRCVAQAGGCNSALVGYHFGNLQGLLAALVDVNLQRMVDDRAEQLLRLGTARSHRDRLRVAIQAFAHPLWLPCALSGQRQAAVLIDEAMCLAETPLHTTIVARINSSVATTVAALVPLLPHLEETRILTRLRLLMGAAITAHPRPHHHGLLLDTSQPMLDTAAELDQFLRFAEAALLAP